MSNISTHRGFSLIELLLAIFILGIGVISIATLFPAGIAQQQKTKGDVMGPIIARNALTILRSRLEQEDFGSAEDFDSRWQFKGLIDGTTISICDGSAGNAVDEVNPWPTICGDWMWFRPAIVPADYGDPDDPACIAVRGAIDIFATPETEVVRGQGYPIVDKWFEGLSPDTYEQGFVPPGIPYNKNRYPDIDEVGSPVDGGPDGIPENLYWPVIRVFAGERQYPMWTGDPAARPEAEYYWDCMFRRYEGRIYVAIFVYRIVDPSQMGAFSVDTTGLTTPDFPRHVNLSDTNNSNPMGYWSAILGDDAEDGDSDIPGQIVGGTQNDDPTDAINQWQYPGQWIVDQNGNVHNVQRGRRRPSDAAVRLASRPNELPGFFSIEHLVGSTNINYDVVGVNVNWWADTGLVSQSQGFVTEGVVTDIWFIPTNDSFGRRIIPVYVTVQGL